MAKKINKKIVLYLGRMILMLIILYGILGGNRSANDKNEKLAQSKQNIALLAESMQSSKWDMGMKKIEGMNSWLYVKHRIYIENCLSEEEIIKRLEYNDFLIIDKLLYSCKDGVQYNVFRPKHFDKMLNFCGYIEFSSQYPSEFEKCQSSK